MNFKKVVLLVTTLLCMMCSVCFADWQYMGVYKQYGSSSNPGLQDSLYTSDVQAYMDKAAAHIPNWYIPVNSSLPATDAECFKAYCESATVITGTNYRRFDVVLVPCDRNGGVINALQRQIHFYIQTENDVPEFVVSYNNYKAATSNTWGPGKLGFDHNSAVHERLFGPSLAYQVAKNYGYNYDYYDQQAVVYNGREISVGQYKQMIRAGY